MYNYIEPDDDINGYGVDYGQFDDLTGYCKHGRYVGGCGIDFMCFECEMGLDTWVEATKYIIIATFTNTNGRLVYHDLEETWDRERAQHLRNMWLDSNIVKDMPPDYDVFIMDYKSGYWSDGKDDND